MARAVASTLEYGFEYREEGRMKTKKKTSVTLAFVQNFQ
jgi:hypothetical protein